MTDLPLAEPEPRDRLPLLLAIGIFATLSIVASIYSDGFSEADGCTHYLYARFAFAQPYYFVNVWGRPLVTAVYSVPAVLGNRLGVRFMSLALAIGCATVARAIAKALDEKRYTLAAMFTLAQPLVFLHSISELTELPFALLLGCAFLAYIKRWWGVMAILIAFSPLARPEGFGFLLLAAIALVLHRRWLWLLLLPLPLIGWEIAGAMLYGWPTYPGLAEHLPKWLTWVTWLAHNWPYADKSAYLPGSIFHFVMLLPAVVSPLIFPAMLIGIWRTSWRSRRDHLAISRQLSVAIPLLILCVHSLLYFTGRMASSGELRYMLVVAPFWAVLANRGWNWLAERFGFVNDSVLIAGLVSLTPILANLNWRVVPLTYSTDWKEARAAADWLKHTPLTAEYPKILDAHPGVLYFLGISPTEKRSLEWTKTTVDAAPPGTILIWDKVYGVYNSDTNRSVKLDEIERAGWIDHPVPAITASGDWHIFVSPQPAASAPSAGVATAPAVPRSPQSRESGSVSSSQP